MMEESENSATDLVFVYGTLKRGFYNWERYLRPELGAEFIGTSLSLQLHGYGYSSNGRNC